VNGFSRDKIVGTFIAQSPLKTGIAQCPPPQGNTPENLEAGRGDKQSPAISRHLKIVIRCQGDPEWVWIRRIETKKFAGMAVACLCFLFATGTTAQNKPTFTTFEAPGAGDGPGEGTIGNSINGAGTIAGQYADASGVIHGFVRAADGAITTFDAPGAGADGTATVAQSIDAAGIIAGYYSDMGGVFHGFVRAAAGTITTFDAPGAGTGAGQGTFASSIDAAGAIAGWYSDASDVYHGFARSASGAIYTFSASGAGRGAYQRILSESIDSAGDIAGYYIDAASVSHGFLRTP
jgi:hypothetical protein